MLEKEFCIYDYKKLLTDEYGYNEDLAEAIALMAESLITYYGEEYGSVVVDAILSCKVCVLGNRKDSIIKEKVVDVLKREDMLEEFDYDEIKDLDFGYFAAPRLAYEDGEYKVKSVDKLIVLPSYFNSDSLVSTSILARVCIKLLKSDLNAYQIDGDKFITKSGVMTTVEKLKKSNGRITRTLKSVTGIGLRNGLDCYDQLCLMRTVYNDDFDVYGAYHNRLLSGYFLDGENFNFKSEIRLAEILHDDSAIKEIFESQLGTTYEEFLKMTDEVASLEKTRRSSCESDEKLSSSTRDLEMYYAVDAARMFRSLEESYTIGRTI